MRFVSAGHLPLLLCRGGAARFLDHHGVLLGVNLSCFTARWSSCCPETDWSSSPTRLPIEQVADHLLDAAGDSDDDVAR